MEKADTEWTATLTLCSASKSPKQAQQVERYVLDKESATFIGRAADCQIVLNPAYSTTSRYHAQIKCTRENGYEEWQACDVNTPNGTFVNGERIEECRILKSGDRLRLGRESRAQFLFELTPIDTEKLSDVLARKKNDTTVVYEEDDGLVYTPEPTQFFIRKSDGLYQPIDVQPISAISADRPDPYSEPPNQPKRTLQELGRKFVSNAWIIICLLFLAPLLSYGLRAAITAQNNTNKSSLDAYIESISTLLLNENLESLSPADRRAIRVKETANGQTRSVLRNLNGEYKGLLIRFLYELKLVRIQPLPLTKAWLSSPSQIINQGQKQLQPADLSRRELVFLSELTFGQFDSSPPPVFLLNNIEFQERSRQGQLSNCDQASSKAEAASDCAWVLSFPPAIYDQALITPMNFSGANLTGIILRDAPLSSVNLEGAYMSFQQCQNNPAGRSLFENIGQWFSGKSQTDCQADLSNAGLQEARLYRAVLRGADLTNAKLNRADLRQADLRGADLTGVQWSGALLTGACYLAENWQTKFPVQGPDGKPFDPVALGMKPITLTASLPGSAEFQECKDVEIAAQ